MLKELMQRLLTDLGKEKNLQIIEEKGGVPLRFVPDLVISLVELNPGLLMMGTLPPPMKTNREALFSFLMQANFLFQGTERFALGLDADGKFLTLSTWIPYEIDYTGFKNILEE